MVSRTTLLSDTRRLSDTTIDGVTVDIRVLRAGTRCLAEGAAIIQYLLGKADADGLVLAVWAEAFKRDPGHQGQQWATAWQCLEDEPFIEMVGANVRVLPPNP